MADPDVCGDALYKIAEMDRLPRYRFWLPAALAALRSYEILKKLENLARIDTG